MDKGKIKTRKSSEYRDLKIAKVYQLEQENSIKR